MSVRYSLLAILDSGPRHGYGLKSEFEAATGNVWPLNVGQVYSTLSRLERDGLVLAGEDDDGQKIYRISDEGRRELQHWYETPVEREVVPRQELAIKLVFAMRVGPERVREVVQQQRKATMGSLQEFTRLKVAAEQDGDLAWLMMLDTLIFQADAEAGSICVRRAWLARTSDRASRGRPTATTAPRPSDRWSTSTDAGPDPRAGGAPVRVAAAPRGGAP
jgi:DNA-binding PadR family transcriptional regulator